MKASLNSILTAGLYPRLQLGIKTARGVQSTGKHTVTVIEDKIIRKASREEGEDPHWMRYIVEENGERKQYDTRLKQKGGSDPSYFVQKMADVEPGEVITLEMKNAGPKNYIDIVRISIGEIEKVEMDDDEPDRSAGEVSANEEPDIL